MDVQEGFILGIYNYCDRWCEACAFTSRCRVFADSAEMEAGQPPQPRWMQELMDEMNTIASEPISEAEGEQLRPRIAPEHQVIETRARAYADRVHAWLDARGFASAEPSDPRAVIGWFQYSITARIHRALYGRACNDADPDWPVDYDGSAKVALVGIERSHAAWLDLVRLEGAAPPEVEPFIADLIWLSDELERVFPRARAFVRPGFDEPDEVARLLAAEGRRA
jgi:hypothetical protein